MAMNFTRRRMAALLLAPVPALAQTEAAGSGDPLQEARQDIRSAVAKMEEVDLDVTVQPAIIFKP